VVMLRVGLTGGLASGKSFVGRALADSDACLSRRMNLGYQVLEPGGEAYEGVFENSVRNLRGGWHHRPAQAGSAGFPR
jgi:dephospho-CoA kinase